ncbi:E3 ubiquitin-protein ligase MARCH2 [Spatholobus suberectus]|nr:E3 ubiquitin-protein ligase MARCH2 [Spatholobus suberectus]
MGDHVTVSPEKFLGTPCQGSSTTQHHIAIPIEELSASFAAAKEEKLVTDAYVDNVQNPEEKGEETEDKGECRYCHEEDFVSKLESPCNCSGSLKYIHRSCIDKWYNSKGYIILCEICMKPYNPNYYPVSEILSDDDHTEIRQEWTIPQTNTRIQSPLVLAERATNRVIASMNKDFSLRKPTGGMILGMALLIFIAVLVIKDAINCVPPKEDTFSRFLYFLSVRCKYYG